MKKPIVIQAGAAVIIGGILLALGLSNPALSEYQTQILVPAAQERRSSSDAFLASILQSLPIAAAPSQDSQDPSGLLTVLTNRTKRDNYLFLSLYSTELDYCQGNTMSRNLSKTVGIAGRFYTLEKGDCPAPEKMSS
jgi:hypothetical protein